VNTSGLTTVTFSLSGVTRVSQTKRVSTSGHTMVTFSLPVGTCACTMADKRLGKDTSRLTVGTSSDFCELHLLTLPVTLSTV